MTRIRYASAWLGVALLLSACGGGEIDLTEIHEGSVLGERPATLRDGGDLVTGTVVKKNADGQMLELTEYVDGYPTGARKTWYENGQQKEDEQVKLGRMPSGQRLFSVGQRRSWCEDGTLRLEGEFDDEGKPVGDHRSWTCTGKELSFSHHPDGEFKRWQELPDGSTVLVAEGRLRAEGFYEGEHKQYFPDGKPMVVETWKDGKKDGPFQRWSDDGSLAESGQYAADAKTGTWMFQGRGIDVRRYENYDPNDFANPEYAGPFMQAAGIDASGQLLREYQVDLEKIDYYVKQGLVDPKKKINVSTGRTNPFKADAWTYPYVVASRGALAKLALVGADPRAVDSWNRQRVHYCVTALFDGACSAEELEALLALGLDGSQTDVRYDNPLHVLLSRWNQVLDPTVAYGGRRKATLADLGPALQMLLDAGADPDAPNAEGFTPIMLAAFYDQFDVAGALLEKSKNPSLVTKRGVNLVHMAFLDQADRFELEPSAEARAFAELAVARGVDPNQKLGDGNTLKQLAEQNGAIDFAQYLAGLKP